MNILNLLFAFAGGVFGAAIGAIPAFIITGLLATISATLSMAGIAENTVSVITFGNFFGPHIAFAGGAAAASYASVKKRGLDSSQNLLRPLFELEDISVLVVGGLFATLGATLCYFFSHILECNTDYPAMSVFFELAIFRLIFGKTGLFGKAEGGKRQFVPSSKEVLLYGFLGAFLGLAVGCGGKYLLNAGVSKEALANYPVFIFGISAFSLIFIQIGVGIPITHHITLPSALVFCLTGSAFAAMVVGLLNAILWLFAGNIFNTDCDTYIDPPATVIFISVLIINLLFM